MPDVCRDMFSHVLKGL
jgi:hypothetical protein